MHSCMHLSFHTKQFEVAAYPNYNYIAVYPVRTYTCFCSAHVISHSMVAISNHDATSYVHTHTLCGRRLLGEGTQQRHLNNYVRAFHEGYYAHVFYQYRSKILIKSLFCITIYIDEGRERDWKRTSFDINMFCTLCGRNPLKSRGIMPIGCQKHWLFSSVITKTRARYCD